MAEIETVIAAAIAEDAMARYVEQAIAMAGFPPASPEQKRGVIEYLAYASAMMAPLLAVAYLGE